MQSYDDIIRNYISIRESNDVDLGVVTTFMVSLLIVFLSIYLLIKFLTSTSFWQEFRARMTWRE